MSQYSKISQVAHYLPSRVVTNDDLSEILDTSDEWIRERTGIGERRVSQGETTSQMAIQVAKALLVKADLEADQLDFIIVATMSPDSMMPSTAAQVQAAIGASRAFAFDVTAACSGFVYALSLADKLICSNAYQKGLVIGAEVISKMLDWTDRSTAVLFGDGAGGVLLESTQEKHFLGESLWTDGTRAKALTAGSKAVTSPFSEGASESAFLQMNGRSVFDFATKDVPKNISQLLASLDLQVDEVDYYLLHQANSRILDKVARKIAVDRDKFLSNLMYYGNTSAASIPILLSESVDKGLLKLDGSQTVLLSGFGGGLTWGSIIVKL